MGNKRTWGDPIGSGAGSGKHDSPMSKGRWFDPSNGRVNGEQRSQRHHDNKAAKKEARAANGSACLPLAIGIGGGLIAALASAAYGVVKVVS